MSSVASRSLTLAEEQERVSMFQSITEEGNEIVCRSCLEAAEWDVERALDLYLSGVDDRVLVSSYVENHSGSHFPDSAPFAAPPASRGSVEERRDRDRRGGVEEDEDELEEDGLVNMQEGQSLLHPSHSGTAYSALPRDSSSSSSSSSSGGGGGLFGFLGRIPGASLLSGIWNFSKRFFSTLFSFIPLSSRSSVIEGKPFREIFEESFPNVEHPAFFEGTLAEALRAALSENRLVLVYLHADSHEDTPTFCRRVMGYTKNPQTSEERFVADSARGLHEFFTDKFIIWGGDIRSAETFSIADRIRIRAYPALVAFSIYPGNPPTVALLRRWEGAGNLRADELFVELVALVEEQNAFSESVRVPDNQSNFSASSGAENVARSAHQYSEVQRLQEEQASEYQAAMLADMERRMEAARIEEERRAREEEERNQRRASEQRRQSRIREQESILANRIQRFQTFLQNENLANAKTVTRVRVRCLSGTLLEKEFDAEETTTQTLYDWFLSENPTRESLRIPLSFPPMPGVQVGENDVIADSDSLSLLDADLFPRVQLLAMKEPEEDESDDDASTDSQHPRLEL